MLTCRLSIPDLLPLRFPRSSKVAQPRPVQLGQHPVSKAWEEERGELIRVTGIQERGKRERKEPEPPYTAPSVESKISRWPLSY